MARSCSKIVLLELILILQFCEQDLAICNRHTVYSMIKFDVYMTVRH